MVSSRSQDVEIEEDSVELATSSSSTLEKAEEFSLDCPPREKEATKRKAKRSQADLMSSELAIRLDLPVKRLIAPIHADLGAEGHEVRLSLYASTSLTVGALSFRARSFFVSPLPAGIDVILGVPWLKDTNSAISADKVFVVPSGPSEEIINLETGRFNPQPRRNLEDLG
ncbi:hypothetical protein JCM5350_002836, partial [Sporobolomyces pararoseus]